MNDEVRQIHDETFNRIVLGLVVFSAAMAVIALIFDGAGSAWFIRSAALFVATVVAIVVRFTSRLVVASYVLVLELLVLGSELLFRSSSSFTPYVFIPIVLATGLLLSPTATLVITGIIVITVLVALFIVGQFSLTGLLLVLPSIGITIVTAFLAIQNKRNVNLLGQRLLENRVILRERTLETMETLKRVETLQQQVVSTEKQLKKLQAEAEQGKSAILQKNSQLYGLMQDSLKELNVSVVDLERSFNELITSPYANGYAGELETVWHRIHQLRVMLINLEEITGIEYGDIKIKYDLVNIGQLVTEVAGTAKGLVIDKNVQVRTRLMDNVPDVQADSVRLRQVLLHLLNNAVKYTDTGTIEIGAKAEEDRVIVQVSDTGIGMHREEVEQVFKKFTRGDSALAQQRQGGGLGLAISKQLIDLQGGRMWVSSVLGVGTTFYIALPAKATPETAKNDATILSTKTTRPFNTVDVPVPQTAAPTPSAAALQNSDNKDNQATLARPVSSTATIKNGDDSIVSPAAPQKKTQFSDNGQTVILRRNIRTSKPPRNATGPVQRYMPFYIQRFGYILLSLLLLVIVTVASLATAKYLFFGDTATTIVSADTAGDSEGTAKTLAATNTATPAKIVAFSVKPTSTPTPVATEITSVLPSDTPTLPLPTDTPVIIPTNTPTPVPSATPLPPTATPSPVPTSTSTPVPANTPTSTPTAQIENTVSQVPQFLVSPGHQLISSLDNVGDVDQNTVPDANSRVSKSTAGQVAFAATGQNSNRDIYVAPGNGSAPINITASPGDDMQPSWSPDGQRVVFSSGRTGNFDIFVANADGSNPVQLTSSRAFDEWPVWSPDGSKIAFVSDRSGNVELYVMNADGSNQQQLTNHPADDWPAAWSPDGQWLVFASNRDGNWNLYLIRAEGGSAFRLTNAPGDERDPIWSPDGQTIAFVYNGSGKFDVYTLPVPANTLTEVSADNWTRVTNTPTDERYPVWGTTSNQLP